MFSALHKLSVVLVLFAAVAFAQPLAAADLIVPRKGEVSAHGVNVPVRLDGLAHDHSKLALPTADKFVTIDNVPFDLVSRPDADNLFLKSAEWPDWQKDPSTYYAAYDKGPEFAGDPRRPLFKIPVGDYSQVLLLAACEDDPAFSNIVSFRIGAFDGPRRTTLHDFSTTVPRFSDTKKAANVNRVIPLGDQAAGKNLYVVRVPLGLAFAQDFSEEWAFDVEVTKELRLAVRRPDPCRYQIRPLGLPSGVHIYGMTFQRAAVQMRVTSTESGHIFNQPQKPSFKVELTQATRKMNGYVEAIATDHYGTVTTLRTDEQPLGERGGSVH